MAQSPTPDNLFDEIDRLKRQIDSLERALNGRFVLSLPTLTTEPPTISGVGQVYNYNGDLKYVSPAGTRTLLAPA